MGKARCARLPLSEAVIRHGVVPSRLGFGGRDGRRILPFEGRPTWPTKQQPKSDRRRMRHRAALTETTAVMCGPTVIEIEIRPRLQIFLQGDRDDRCPLQETVTDESQAGHHRWQTD